MNDQHPHAGYAGYGSQATGSFATDPLFGSLPGGHGNPGGHDSHSGHDGRLGGGYDNGPGGGYDSGLVAGQPDQAGYSGHYDSSQWDTGAHPTASYDAVHDPYAAAQPPYTAGPTYDTTATWTPVTEYDTFAAPAPAMGHGFADVPAQPGAPGATGQWDTSGQWDTNGWYETGQWATTHTAAYSTGSYDTGAYDATAWNTGAAPEPEHEQHSTQLLPEVPATAEHPAADDAGSPHEVPAHASSGAVPGASAPTGTDDGEAVDPAAETVGIMVGPRRSPDRPTTRGGTGGRSRRRSPTKRSALLTVAVPSACVMSVAGIAAASVSGLGGESKKDDNTTTMAAADPGSVKPVAANNKLDTQLANLSADAENFLDRASRTQERIDLRERQAAEKKKREDEAARKEALRPKFVVPVAQHGLSAYFGQAGVNWMSVHTGIDFPVSYGTPVMAATDGTVRTQWNNAYGNMAIVTMADGTETWYCHLSSTKIRSGPVKAGDVIAYSGSSGNSTGPHMHFEVRPGGGAAINPLPWLRGHGVNPT
ncbi:peptidoglycan DD-metalloendopeptidase family protein [Streptomyces sp. NPDC014734]|uniref:peptidoglycan DD-metalloendopeptidase family protein n=1 Tax=Streptomyces sp. NPDC014734 TaxID=3364886 RepID=UPI003701C091